MEGADFYRGFERLEEKLARCGAKIQRITV